MEKIYNVVLTGGTCGGKSQGIDYVVPRLRSMGYKVITIPETAKQLHDEGLEHEVMPVDLFQEILFERQLEKENTARKGAKYYAEKRPVVILHDRGLFDGNAYMDDKAFKEMAAAHGVNYKDIPERYDMAFHMVSASIGAEQYFNLDNPSRTENLKFAKKLEMRTLEVGKNYRNRVIIDNSTTFEWKLNRLYQTMLTMLREMK